MSKTIRPLAPFARPATLLLAAVLAAGCGGAPSGSAGDGEGGAGGRVRVVATTGMLGDAVTRVGGDRVAVDTLMGPGVDPHLYKASEGDVQRLSAADLIVYNGLHLEGKMTDILGRLAARRPVLAVGETLPPDRLVAPPEFEGQYDPHVWFDVELWSRTLEGIAEALAERSPADAETFRANAAAYAGELQTLDAWARERIEEIPEGRRVLITAHDAFGYFGRRYGLEVFGIQGLSTLSEAGLRDIQRVADVVVEGGIPAIFVESSVPRRAIEAVQAACADRGAPVAIGGELFSDAMGTPGTPEGTYVGMVRHNVDTIVEALR